MAEVYEVMKGGERLAVGVTRADFRRTKGLLGETDRTLEDAGYDLYDPETGKALVLDEPRADEPKAESKKKGE